MRNTLSAIALIAWSGCALAQEYTITQLPTLNQSAEVNGINDEGTITGALFNPGGSGYAFVYSNGTTTKLGSLGGTSSVAYAANASGQAVGYSYITGNVAPHAFFYSNGTMTDIGAPGGFSSIAFGINDSGQVVGFNTLTSLGSASAQAFLYSNGKTTELGVLGSAQAINNAGQIAGYGSFSNGEQAFLYSNGVITELGTPSGTYSNSSFAYGMNNLGQVVGVAGSANNATGPRGQAMLYKNGTMTTLGTLSGAYDGDNIAWGINDAGQIVGNANKPDGSSSHAFLYSNGTMKDLNSLIDPTSPLAAYVTLTIAAAINDYGWIVADGADSRTGDSNAYLLTPLTPTAMLAALLKEVTGVGPGTSLAGKVTSAQTYYAVPDVQATCAVLTGFVSEVQAQNGKKIPQTLDAKLIADANAIEVAIGCN